MHARAFINRRPRPQQTLVLLSRIYTHNRQTRSSTHIHLGGHKKIASAAYANVWKKANVVLSEYEIIVYNCKLFNTLQRQQSILWSDGQLVHRERERERERQKQRALIALSARKVEEEKQLLFKK